jgi:LmbE family N-acetylglucosaminyl deacetylase
MLHPDFARLEVEDRQTAEIRLGRALKRLTSTLGFMQTGAHPDDEANGLLALLAFRDGHRTSFACSTHGDGGQNGIGPEKGLDLAMIRTREMEEAARVLGLRLYWFSDELNDPIRDFRFSKSAEETFSVWGRDRALERMVRIFRREKPDCVCPTFLDVGGQHGHHRAMTRIAREAFEIAGDPAAFPRHAEAGLAPFAPAKFYLPAWSGAGGSYDDEEPPPPAHVHHDTGEIDPLSGAPYARIGEWSRRFHATQGMGRWIEAAPTPRDLSLVASRVGPAGRRESGIGDGLPTTLGDWAGEPGAPSALKACAEAIARAGAARAFSEDMIEALDAARRTIEQAIADCPDSLKGRLLHRLERKRRDIAKARALAEGRAPDVAGAPIPATPALSVEMTPDALMFNLAGGRRVVELDIVASGPDHRTTPSLAAPQGLAAEAAAPIGGDAVSTRFRLRLHADPDLLAPGEAALDVGGRPASRLITADTPHVGRASRVAPVVLRWGKVDCAIRPGTRVAYVGGGHDQCARWLREIGVEVVDVADGTLDDFALSGFSTVLVGIFTLGWRPDVTENIGRLHAFVRAGGHLVTLYHRPTDGWDPLATPLAPIHIVTPSLRYRVTDQRAEVTHLIPDHPILTGPNVISERDWAGWRKERGLYFAARWDAAYDALLSMADPGEEPLKGGLLSGRFGKGRHTHCALALHGELDSLTPGAFRLMANLIA